MEWFLPFAASAAVPISALGIDSGLHYPSHYSHPEWQRRGRAHVVEPEVPTHAGGPLPGTPLSRDRLARRTRSLPERLEAGKILGVDRRLYNTAAGRRVMATPSRYLAGRQPTVCEYDHAGTGPEAFDCGSSLAFRAPERLERPERREPAAGPDFPCSANFARGALVASSALGVGRRGACEAAETDVFCCTWEVCW
jgi:hypothetical protein